MAKIKKTVAVLIFAALLFSLPRALAVTDANILADIALLVEPESGTILYPMGERAVKSAKSAARSPDGLTKIMTVLLIAEACQRGELDARELVTMTELALEGIDANDSGTSIKLEEEMSLSDLMYSAYLGSSDEACNMLAMYARGSIDNFVAAMNARAAELGCTDTRFTNTHGAQDGGQYTTAWDIYLIYSAAMENDLFATISSTIRYKTEGTNISASRTLTNPNYLLSDSSRYYYRYCTGGRPSATYESGYNLVASAEREGMRLVSVVLGAKAVVLEDESTQMQNLSETKRLFEWGFSSYSWRDVLSQSELVEKVPVKFGAGADYVNLRPESTITVLAASDVPDDEFKRDIVIYSQRDGTELTAPVSRDEVLGEITLTLGGEPCGTVKLVANTSVGLRQTEYMKTQILGALSSRTAKLVIAGVALLFVGYIVLLIRYSLIRRERIRRIREAKRQIAEERQRQFEEERQEIFRE